MGIKNTENGIIIKTCISKLAGCSPKKVHRRKSIALNIYTRKEERQERIELSS